MPESTLPALTAAVRAHAAVVAPGAIGAVVTIAGGKPGEWLSVPIDLSPVLSPSAELPPGARS